jgi:hypothetical protein
MITSFCRYCGKEMIFSLDEDFEKCKFCNNAEDLWIKDIDLLQLAQITPMDFWDNAEDEIWNEV